jgi:hypothetical protein
MILYNVTSKVEWSIHEEWLLWMKEEHIPEVIATGCFTHSKFLRLIEVDETDGPTYAVQYFAESKANYNRYIENYSTQMRKKVFDKWGTKSMAFRTVMQVVH